MFLFQHLQCTESSCIISGGDETRLISVVINMTQHDQEEELMLEKRIEKLEKVQLDFKL